MRETNPASPDQDTDQVLLSPELAFGLVKSAQALGKGIVDNLDESKYTIALYPVNQTPGEPVAVEDEGKGPFANYFELQYGGDDEYLGNIREWDGKLFSYQQSGLEERSYPQLFMLFPIDSVDHPALEVNYSTFNHEIGAVGGVDVVIPFESPARIRETTVVDKSTDDYQQRGPEGEWRPMTQDEGLRLLEDLRRFAFKTY